MNGPSSPTTSRFALWSLLFGNFLIGTGVLLPSGLLNDIAQDFSLTAAQAGFLVFVGGLVVGIGAPLFATWTSAIDRRTLLTGCLLLYAVGHLASAVVPGFSLQILVRALTVVGAAVFTPQAAATLGLMVPADKRAAATAFIFIGWSAASVVGIPLGTLLAPMIGWRLVYVAMAVLCLFGAAAVHSTLRPGLYVQPLGLSAWKQVFGVPVTLLIFLVTLFSMAGQFSMIGYIAPLLRDGFGASAKIISLSFAVVGLAGVVGNSLASRIVGRFGTDQVIAAGLVSLMFGFAGFGIFFGNYWPALAASVFWGLGSFSSNSLQQSRLATLAPQLASVTIALNTSFVYLGQSMGSFAGGKMIDAGQLAKLPWMALAFMAVALSLSLLASKFARKN